MNDEMKMGALIELQGVKEEISTIKAELSRKGIDTPKGFSTLEAFVDDRIAEMKA